MAKFYSGMSAATPPRYRLIWHAVDGKRHVATPASRDRDKWDELSHLLDHLVNDDRASGGHIEERVSFVDGPQWVVSDERPEGGLR